MKKLILFALCLASFGNAKALQWFSGDAVSYHISGKTDPVVSIALQMFCDDMQQVTGKKAIEKKREATIEIIQTDKTSRALLTKYGVPSERIRSAKDAFFVAVRGDKIVVAGNNGRGTAYGLLELSRLAGVSPWVWWNDSHPERKNSLTISDTFETFQAPSVEYRGIFLNDEDWSLRQWSQTNYDKSDKFGTIGPKTYKRIFQLLLRLRANTIWPGMHTGTVAFFKVAGNKAIADSCGIVIGTSHCEPLLRNNVDEWDVSKRGRYNYITNRESVINYWVERLQETRGGEYLYTIGMRGIHDGSMEGVKTMKEKTEALQQVINDQRKLISKYVDKNVERVPQVFVPYKEVLQIMENGLDVPDDVTLMWCDDNYGYMTRLSDAEQQKRSGGAGVYYHLSYWGRPHDYLWLTTTQPGLIYNEMKEAYDNNARKLWIVNVHDVKVAAYDLELFLDMAWDINAVKPNTLRNHLQNWLSREFGSTIGAQLLPVMEEWFRLTAIRKPEFMGWTQVELDRKHYPRGRSQVINTEFSDEFGGEMSRYLDEYLAICKKVDELKKQISADKTDAYFAAIEYPIKASQAMAEKMLEAQRARTMCMGQTDSTMILRESKMRVHAAKSQIAYKRIKNLTKHYNDNLANGKWKGIMDDSPRDLYVFYPPLLPEWVDDAEGYLRQHSDDETPMKWAKNDDPFFAFNANQYAKASSDVFSVQMLGHSMNALNIPKGGYATYNFTTSASSDALLHVAMIPTQPNDKGDLRFSVSIDGGDPTVFSLKEPFRSDTWKLSVLRGQAVKQLKINLSAGQHSVTVKALDDHIVLDQMLIDFKTDRKFYVIPTSLK